jgi:hypothetical protein
VDARYIQPSKFHDLDPHFARTDQFNVANPPIYGNRQL